MTTDSQVAELRRRSAAFHPPGEQLGPVDSRAQPAPGQVWETYGRPPFPEGLPEPLCSDEPLLVVLLRTDDVALDGHSVHLAAPLFGETLYAGPTDVLLPRQLFGHRKAVAVGYAVTLLGDSLAHCRGTLPEHLTETLQHFLHAMDSGSELPAQLATGLPYLDEEDVRYRFHEDLASWVECLQGPALAWAERCGMAISETEADPLATDEKPSGILLDLASLFPKQALTMAAADAPAARPLATGSYACEEIGVTIQLSQAVEPGCCALEVIHDPENRMEGAEIRDPLGAILAHVNNATAFFRITEPPSLSIVLTTGVEVRFGPTDESTS